MSDDGWPPGFFDRQDPSDDGDFYAPPRFVTHIDDGAIAAVRDLYDELGVPDGRVLDLMSSWVSHLSREPSGGLVALGMNAAELQANPLAEVVVVHDLNVDPRLPFEDASFAAVTCCVSIDYLLRPVEVLREVARVLRPSGVVAITFSNRCFPTKAVAVWQGLDGQDQCELVSLYLRRAGFPTAEIRELVSPGRWGGDPLRAVIGRKEEGNVG